MASTEDRVRQLIADNLEVDGESVDSVDLDKGLTDIGVSSMDVVSFARVVQEEFGISFAIEDCADLKTVRQMIEYIDSNAA